MDETLVFIDSGFLSKLSKHFGKGKYIAYDIVQFASNLAKSQNLLCKKIFYYTAPPFQGSPSTKEENKRKENYDKFVKKISKDKIVAIREGRCQRIKNDDGNFEYCQKGVDTLMTMDMVSVPIKYHDVKQIILFACDSDFVPVIKNLKQFGIRTLLYTYYEKNRNSRFSTSNELTKIVDKYILLNKEDFLNATLEKRQTE